NSTEEKSFIEMDENDYYFSLVDNNEFNSNLVRLEYSSLKTPKTIYDYNMDTKEKIIKKKQKMSGNYNSENYVTDRIFAKTEGGIQIPISLVYKKGLIKDGKN